MTACHVTDAVFAVSAGRLCVFDPTGQALGGSKEGGSDGSAKSYWPTAANSRRVSSISSRRSSPRGPTRRLR